MFTAVSIFTGVITRFDPNPPELPPMTVYEQLYFFGEQLCEILLLYVLYRSTTNKQTLVLLRGLLFLSVSEMIDEVCGNNLDFAVNDYVLIVVVIYVVYKTTKVSQRWKNG